MADAHTKHHDYHIIDPSPWPLFGSIAETWYAKPMGGQLMVSPADADPVPPQDAWPDDMVLAEGLHRFETAVTVPVTRVVSSWAGLRSFAPDKTPVCGFDTGAEGFLWLAGQGGWLRGDSGPPEEAHLHFLHLGPQGTHRPDSRRAPGRGNADAKIRRRGNGSEVVEL